MTYRVVVHPWPRPAALAVARRYSELADAVAAMGEGAVFGADGHLAAFHERHLSALERQYLPKP